MGTAVEYTAAGLSVLFGRLDLRYNYNDSQLNFVCLMLNKRNKVNLSMMQLRLHLNESHHFGYRHHPLSISEFPMLMLFSFCQFGPVP